MLNLPGTTQYHAKTFQMNGALLAIDLRQIRGKSVQIKSSWHKELKLRKEIQENWPFSAQSKIRKVKQFQTLMLSRLTVVEVNKNMGYFDPSRSMSNWAKNGNETFS